jgi:hypothetical protein
MATLRIVGLALVAALAACDRPPAVDDPTQALAAPGTSIPAFSFPSIHGWTFDRSRLLYGHTLVALVPANATGTEPELVEFGALKDRHSMFRFAVVYPRALEARDTTYLNPPSWLARVQRGYASDSQLAATFATTDPDRRAALRLPSFLLVSDSGKVLARVAGRPAAVIGPVLDSLRAIRDSTRRVSGDAEVARARPRLERGLPAFDPVTLVASGDARLDGTCGSEEEVPRGVIPAIARLVDLEARHPGVVATVEMTSVADVEPIDGDDACRGGEVRVTPRVATRRYRVDLYEAEADSTGAAEWGTDGSIELLADGDGGGRGERLMLLGLPEADDRRRLRLPAGVTLQALRARVDSIRAAAR